MNLKKQEFFSKKWGISPEGAKLGFGKSMKIMNKTSIFALLLTGVIGTGLQGTERVIGGSVPNIAEISTLYTDSYSYSLPRKILESYRSGVAFDHKTPYTQEELSIVDEHTQALYEKAVLSSTSSDHPIAVMTAGAPGAGKTWKMRQELSDEEKRGNKFAYVDPDDNWLLSFYQRSDIAPSVGTPEERRVAYTKWRPASNFGAQAILANLIQEKRSFYYGTTSTSPQTGKFLSFLKERGYEIRLIHVTAPDDIRWQSIVERDKTFVQTTEEDTREKGLLLPERINDTFLQYADTITFCYRDRVSGNAQPAAVWTRNPKGDQILGTLSVTNFELYEKIRALHNTVVNKLQKPELTWENTVERQSILAP